MSVAHMPPLCLARQFHAAIVGETGNAMPAIDYGTPGGTFASREESLKTVVGDLGRSPSGGNLVLSVKVTGEGLRGSKGYLNGWYVELDFQGGGNSFKRWAAREHERKKAIAQDSMIHWCSPPPAPPRPVCPEWVLLLMFRIAAAAAWIRRESDGSVVINLSGAAER